MHRKTPKPSVTDADTAPKDNTRMCIVTRETLPKEALIRFVISPEGVVVPDLSSKLPGRGLWVKAELAIVAQAAVKGAFSRAAKMQAHAPAGLAAQVEKQLRQRTLDALSMVRKAGLLIAGYEKVARCLIKQEAVALIHASEAALDGRKDLDAKAHSLLIINCFTREELNQVSARENATHLVLLSGTPSEFFLLSYRRFTGFS